MIKMRRAAFYLLSMLILIACGGGDNAKTTNQVTNSAPIANAGIDLNVMTGSMVRLDGSGSSSPDANAEVLTFAWTIQSTPFGSSTILNNAKEVNPTFTADLVGPYLISLVVNDGKVDSVADTVTVTAATPVANSAPIANAGIDQNVITGLEVRLDGSGSGDANTDMLTYAWTIQSAPAGSSTILSDATGVNPTFTADLAGPYLISLVVNDGKVDSAADTVKVTAAKETTKDLYVTIGQFGISINETDSKWWGGVRGTNNKIYGIPFNAEDILIIDPATNTATRSTMVADMTGTNKWASGCRGPDGKIYCVPYGAPDVLIIDPVAGIALRTDFGLDLRDTNKWAGAVLGADKKIYGIPRDSSNILIIDPAKGTASRSSMGASLSGDNKWSGGILAANGKIYGLPRDAEDILIIDPASGTASRSNMGAALTPSHQYAGGTLAPNGKIYAIPYTDCPDILIIDPAVNTATLSSMGANLYNSGWSEAILGPDHKIYAVPYTASDMLVIDTAAGTASRSPVSGVGQTSTGKWVMGDIVNNEFYGIPYGSQNIIRAEFISPVDSLTYIPVD